MILDNKEALQTALKMSLAGLLAFSIYLTFRLPFGYWSIITIAAVVRPGLTNTLSKALLRIVGTILGAIFGLIILTYCANHEMLMILGYFLIICCSSYIGIQKNVFNYAGIIAGVTTTIVIASGLTTHDPQYAAMWRMLEVFIGIICLMFVDLVLSYLWRQSEAPIATIRQEYLAARASFSAPQQTRVLFSTAIIVGLTMTAVFVPWLVWQYTNGFWAAISCLFIMEENLLRVQKKSWSRFSSHVIAAVIGSFSALVFTDNAWFLAIPLTCSFFAFGYFMSINKELSNMGNTMGIALAIMLLTDIGRTASLEMIMFRFSYTVLGIIVGLTVLKCLNHFSLTKPTVLH